MNFNTPPQEPSLPQTHAIPPQEPSLPQTHPPNEFFTGLDDLIQKLEFDLYSKMSENQIDTYQSKPHLNMFNHMQDNRNPSNIQNLSEFHINFNKPVQQRYLPQPPPLPSLVPPSNFFAGLNVWIQIVGLNYFNGNMIENQIITYFNTDNGNHSNVLRTKDLTMICSQV
ncbi:hypothetical protein AABB24_030048 [Solanum stoloniferum]|uniref:Uncharacterized protein n=1 Tax=Solanum stoloniferum TaxID=62892 RepID=A0ABD2S130_9SOLN